MPQFAYFGWSKDWFDEAGDPKVGEILIKLFVNRYFAFPEDYDEDDIPLIMIFVKCRVCGSVQEHYTTETEEDARKFIYNRDNFYISLEKLSCTQCGLVWNRKLEEFWMYQSIHADEIYRHISPQFESPLEVSFWKTWKEKCPHIPLIPQYRIGKYRVDFAYPPTRTAIELDGKQYHSAPSQIAYDKIRQAEIEQRGWHFLRFTGSSILLNVDWCVLDTLRFLAEKAYTS